MSNIFHKLFSNLNSGVASKQGKEMEKQFFQFMELNSGFRIAQTELARKVTENVQNKFKNESLISNLNGLIRNVETRKEFIVAMRDCLAEIERDLNNQQEQLVNFKFQAASEDQEVSKND